MTNTSIPIARCYFLSCNTGSYHVCFVRDGIEAQELMQRLISDGFVHDATDFTWCYVNVEACRASALLQMKKYVGGVYEK